MKRIREWGAKTIIVDIAVELIKNFLYQVCNYLLGTFIRECFDFL